MRYLLKQKLLSLAGVFHIKNDQDQDVFVVEGQLLSFGHQLTFRDMSGNELAFIRQKLLSWGPTYEIYRDGQLFATVKKELFSFFKHKFTVDVPGPDDLVAERRPQAPAGLLPAEPPEFAVSRPVLQTDARLFDRQHVYGQLRFATAWRADPG